MATAATPLFLPQSKETNATPKVWHVISTGVKEREIDICASEAIIKEPDKAAKILWPMLLSFLRIILGIKDCSKIMRISWAKNIHVV